jgi:hypothetical protein
MTEILNERTPEIDLHTIAEHLARHGRGGRVSRALWALVERQHHPYKVIYDDGGSPYLLRIYQTQHTQHQLGEVTEERRLPAVYLHYFFRGDLDRELHNHPWGYGVSLILSGGYVEERYDGPLDQIAPSKVRTRTLRPGSVNIIRHDTYHRVRMINGTTWSLFFAGPRVAATRGEDWGFIDPHSRSYESWGERDRRRLAEARGKVREFLAEGNNLIYALNRMRLDAPPCEPRCDDEYCAACAMTECPHHEPLHRHHDGCPACYQPPARDHVCLKCGLKQYAPADGFCAGCGGDSTVVSAARETGTSR